MPLFANCTLESLLVILTMFLSLVGVWCYAAYRLNDVPVIAEVLIRYGNLLMLFVLIGLGLMILNESHTLEDQTMLTLTLIASAVAMVIVAMVIVAMVTMNRKALLPQVEKN